MYLALALKFQSSYSNSSLKTCSIKQRVNSDKLISAKLNPKTRNKRTNRLLIKPHHLNSRAKILSQKSIRLKKVPKSSKKNNIGHY